VLRTRAKKNSGSVTRRSIKAHVWPRIRNKSIYDLQRRGVVAVDAIEDENQSWRIESPSRKAFNWRAARDDSSVPHLTLELGEREHPIRVRVTVGTLP
jgi:hypothetical protein